MINPENISAIILAGGKSSRMGSDKGLVEFSRKKMIEHVLGNVKSVINEILIVSNNHEYKSFGCPVFEDINKNCGPLGGIHAGLSYSKTEWNLIVGCDMPFITPEFISFLISNISTADAVIPVHNGNNEPLCGLYHKSSLTKLESLLLKQELKMQNVLKILETKFIEVPDDIFDADLIFKNINSPEDVV